MTESVDVIGQLEQVVRSSWFGANLPGHLCTARWTRTGALCMREGKAQFGDTWLCDHHTRRLEDDLAAKLIRQKKREAEQQARDREAALADANAASVVYFLQRRDELIKIGYTSRFSQRLATLRREHGPLDLLAKHRGSRDAEQATHRRFSDDRVEGEWFLPSEELLAHIADVRTRQAYRLARAA